MFRGVVAIGLAIVLCAGIGIQIVGQESSWYRPWSKVGQAARWARKKITDPIRSRLEKNSPEEHKHCNLLMLNLTIFPDGAIFHTKPKLLKKNSIHSKLKNIYSTVKKQVVIPSDPENPNIITVPFLNKIQTFTALVNATNPLAMGYSSPNAFKILYPFETEEVYKKTAKKTIVITCGENQ